MQDAFFQCSVTAVCGTRNADLTKFYGILVCSAFATFCSIVALIHSV